jgi:CxxC-x17-CxxC domain-containing protein
MTYFNRGGGSDRGGFGGGNRNSGRPSFGGGSDRDGGRPQLFSAVCDECGKTCEVPFRPNGSKPIYCSQCFENKGGNGRGDRDGGRPSFRDNRDGGFGGFGGNDRNADRTTVRRFESNGKPIDNTSEKLDKISDKLDKLITLLTPKVEKVEAVSEEAPVKKAKKAKKTETVEVTE